MDQVSAFQAYTAASSSETQNKPKSGKTKKTPRPDFIIPGKKTSSKKRKRVKSDTQSGSNSDSESETFSQSNGHQSPSGSSPSSTQSSGKKSKKPKRNGDASSGMKPRKTSKQMSSDDIEVIDDSSDSSSSSSNYPTQSTRPTTVSRNSSSPFSTSTVASNSSESNSTQIGCDSLKFMLSGLDLNTFMAQNWEKIPCYIGRHGVRHYDCLQVSRETIDEMLRNNNIEYTKNLDVTMYENGVRQTYNPDGRACAASVWQYYAQGCSIRLLNPQTYMPALHQFNAKLQEYFHCLVGANVYLTPPDSQGFAPHYDDIEAFVLQIEGKKEWFLYEPRTDHEVLPRESSKNFQQDDLGEPIFKQVLCPGDILYFPRGWIHQAKTVEGQHSLHITLSVYQKNAFADLFEIMTKQALDKAINSNVKFREGLPLDIWNNFGCAFAGFNRNESRTKITNHIKTLFHEIVEKHLDVDDAVDKMAMKFQHDALPPVLTADEKPRTAAGTAPRFTENGWITMPDINRRTQVRLIRANILRLTNTNDAYHLYYYSDNSKEYHQNDLNFLELDESSVDIVKKLIHNYPKYTKVRHLSENHGAAQAVAYELWDRGLLMTNAPLK